MSLCLVAKGDRLLCLDRCNTIAASLPYGIFSLHCQYHPATPSSTLSLKVVIKYSYDVNKISSKFMAMFFNLHKYLYTHKQFEPFDVVKQVVAFLHFAHEELSANIKNFEQKLNTHLSIFAKGLPR